MATHNMNRVARACERCRRNKIRCDPWRPCALCVRSGSQCISDGEVYDVLPVHDHRRDSSPASNPKRRRTEQSLLSPVAIATVATREPRQQSAEPERADAAITIARNIYRLESQQLNDECLSAIPGADSPEHANRQRQAKARRMPISSILTNSLPSEQEVSILMTEYFESVHWFSLVILEPRFRPMFDSVRDGWATPSEEPFLLLLSTMLGLAARYLSQKSNDQAKYWLEWSKKLIANAENQMTKLLEHSSLLTIQTLTLLGSFYVYFGRPSLSFSILGATIKAAQAAGLHHEVTRVSKLDAEERKRAWWTVYTWDRFASINYGRPLGINDKDCSVTMPEMINENTTFVLSSESSPNGISICFSAYQKSLNELYAIASPALESLYSARESESVVEAQKYVTILQQVTTNLWHWRRSLQDGLSLDLENDCSPNMQLSERAQCLQALSLHLTFESLLIILHRPFLKQQLELVRSENGASGRTRSRDTPPANTLGPSQWWDAAVRTAKVTSLSTLIGMAIDSHLASFLALNLFNAAIVMVVLALSEPLNDRAQEAKRSVSRIYQFQKSLGGRSILSKQSAQVIHTLVELLLRKEREIILEPFAEPLSDRQTGRNIVNNMALQNERTEPSRETMEDDITRGQSEIQNDRFDLASRLDVSLASVQKVFAAGQYLPHAETTEYHDVPGSSQNFQATDSQLLEPNYPNTGFDLSNFDVTTVSDSWNDITFNVTDGIGWFWDPSWGDVAI